MIIILKKFRIHKIIAEISIYAFVLGAACQYFDGFLESNSRSCDVILAVIVMSGDAFPLYYVTWNNRTKDVRRCGQLYAIIVKGHSIVRGKVNSGVN